MNDYVETVDPSIRYASSGDLPVISRMVERVFNSTVAPNFSKEGVRTFKGYIDPELLKQRIDEGSILLVAYGENEDLLGMIMTKGKDHISLFFVREELQGKGIGRSLLERLIDDIRKDHLGIEWITVNSSPNSVTAYERLGFGILEPERTLHGISYTRMERIIRP